MGAQGRLMTPRCCICRATKAVAPLEWTELPGTGWRCVNRRACRGRVRGIVRAWRGLKEACGG